jgi:catechol 2,3-dioxygenase-like lactoylglutathione lyase family enzyme
MKPRITVITIGVDDLERAVAFYRDGLGLPSWATTSASATSAGIVSRTQWIPRSSASRRRPTGGEPPISPPSRPAS